MLEEEINQMMFLTFMQFIEDKTIVSWNCCYKNVKEYKHNFMHVCCYFLLI